MRSRISIRGSVRPSVGPSVRPSVRPSVGPSVRNAFVPNSRKRYFMTSEVDRKAWVGVGWVGGGGGGDHIYFLIGLVIMG